MNNVNVINKAGKDVVVTVSNIDDDSIQVLIELQKNKVELSKLKPGDVFKSKSGTEYILWYFMDDGSAAILRKDVLEKKMKFGENNNFDGSNVDQYLNTTYIKELESEFGAENIVEHEVNLLSLDGLDDYGKIRRKVSIPTVFQYCNNRKTIGKNMETWWWLATPDSTPSGYGSGGVHYVGSDGGVNCGWYGDDGAVRPFFVLKSSIFASLDNVEA